MQQTLWFHMLCKYTMTMGKKREERLHSRFTLNHLYNRMESMCLHAALRRFKDVFGFDV